MDGELFGQVVIITCAGRGIGRAVGAELAAAGARLVLVSRTRADLERAAGEIGEDRATVIAGDVTDEATAAAAVARVVRAVLATGPNVWIREAFVTPLQVPTA